MVGERRILVFTATRLTYGLLGRFWWRAIVTNFIPVLLLVALYAAQIWLAPRFEPEDPDDIARMFDHGTVALSMLLVIVSIAPWTMLFVAFIRIGMSNAVESNGWFGLRWGRRETCVFLRGLLIALLLALISIPISFGLSAVWMPIITDSIVDIDPLKNPMHVLLWMSPMYIVMGLPIAYFGARWGLYVPSPALDQSVKLGDSWKATTGNGWRLVAILILVSVPFAAFSVVEMIAIFKLGVATTRVWEVLSVLIDLVGSMISAFVLAVIYDFFAPKATPATEAELAPTESPALE